MITGADEVIGALRTEYIAAAHVREDSDAYSHEELDVNPRDRTLVLQLISHAPTEVDDIIRESKLPTAMVLGILLELELAGRVVRSARQTITLA